MTTSVEKVNGYAVAEPRFDPLALAQAEAIRTEADAKAAAVRIEAEGKARAAEILAEQEAEKQRLTNERTALRNRREMAVEEAKIAEANAKREEAERATKAARAAEEAERKATGEQQGKREQSAKSWRTAALSFAVVCAIVALPVQMSAFWSPSAPWLLIAPLVLEGGAWVVLKGAAAAVDDHRPHWHYRLIAWSLAFVAAGINLAHGIHAFDIATAAGTAFASLAGPGIWDLHEHGRIRLRDGKLTRRQRREQRAAERKAGAAKAAAEKRATAERQAREKAAVDAAEKLATERAEHFPKVWAHALRLAAALGEASVTEAVWKRAHLDIEGAEPGESVDIITGRTVAERRVDRARSGAQANTASKTMNAQRASQMPSSKKGRVYNPPARAGRRTKGDTPKYVAAARKQAAITARIAATEEQS